MADIVIDRSDAQIKTGIEKASDLQSSASEIDNSVMMIGNVKNFGATGDGVTDDTLSIQNTLDANANGGKVFFPKGTYVISNSTETNLKGGLRFYSNQHIQGSGHGSIIKLAGDVEGADYTGLLKMSMFLGSSSDVKNVKFSDLQLDGNKNDQSTGAVEMEGLDFVGVSGSYTDRIIVENCYIHDITHDAIDLDSVRYATINSNFIINCGYNAIHSGQQNTSIIMDGNYIENCGHQRKADAIDDLYGGLDNSAENAIVTNNIIVSCPRGIRIAGSGTKTIVTNNIVSQTDSGDWGMIVDSGYMNVSNNVIFDNSGESNGIKVTTTSTGGAVVGNMIRATGTGIDVDCSGSIKVSENTITSAPYNHSIKLAGGEHICSNNSLQGKPSNSSRGAIHIIATAQNTQVLGNKIKGTTNGASIYSLANNTLISNNICTEASSGGYEIVIEGNDNVVNSNRITSAATSAVKISIGATRTLSTSNNFNGSVLGIEDNGTSSISANNIA